MCRPDDGSSPVTYFSSARETAVSEKIFSVQPQEVGCVHSFVQKPGPDQK